ncbi:MAG: phosphatase [Bacteroidia bacterium]|nr:phosphatase [Bacteroidia bacterium]
MRVAVIDIGTNTFNLLIADVYIGHSFRAVHRQKFPAKLGKNGLASHIITDDAFERGIKSLQSCIDIISRYHVLKIFSIGTATLRNAKNTAHFLDYVKKELGLDIRVISGNEEAELTYYGVRMATPLTDEKALILDIGGGSIEFLIANSVTIFWKQSFNSGIAWLLEIFHPGEPIKKDEITALEQYLQTELQPLFKAAEQHPVKTLIGASSTFSALAGLICCRDQAQFKTDNRTCHEINIEEYRKLHEYLLTTTIEDRLKIKGVDLMRVEMLVIGSIFINFIINKLSITRLIQSNYAIKEGLISKIIKE